MWPPLPRRLTSIVSAAAVNGPERTPTRPTGSCGAQCSAKIARDVLQATGRDDLGRAGRDALLAGLEQQPDPAGQLVALGELGQRQAGAEQDRGVHVVAAGVATPSTVDR